MRSFWKIINNRRSVSNLLTLVVLFSVLLPAHYHLHHLNGADSADHAHVVDLHLFADNHGQSHHDEDTNIFSATPDVIVNKEKFAFSLHLPVVILLVLFLAQSHRVWNSSYFRDLSLIRYCPYFSPPLRAPPLD